MRNYRTGLLPWVSGGETNVPFSGTVSPETDDWLQRVGASYPHLHTEVWDYSTIEAMLDRNYTLRRSFSELTYTADFFKRVVERVSSATL